MTDRPAPSPATAFSAADHSHMAHALQLAARGLYSTAPNPSVGCVLLDASGARVGEGWHLRAGEPHAEVLALRQSQGRERGGTAYVTLEPCSHHGRTPPCVDAVLAAGLRRVVVAMEDPNPQVAGGGCRRLVEAGVDVQVGLLASQAAELNRGFVARMTRGRPWVTLKLGTSIDGRTALADGASRWITGPAARADVQKLRARASAVLTAIGTVLADDPALTVRDPTLETHGRQPLRVVLDARGDTPAASQLVRDGFATLVLTGDAGASALRAKGVVSSTVTVDVVELDADGRVDLAAALRRLAERGCNEVLVESGPRLAGNLLAAGLVDEAVVYLAPTILGDSARPAFTLPLPLRSLADRQCFQYRDVRLVGNDVRLTLRPVETEA
jgi:diaminohydroxyphosphoribosylaminopyrimidine deaminase/5-amino-6-(5-phosphoribosylamino)uracil reductase